MKCNGSLDLRWKGKEEKYAYLVFYVLVQSSSQSTPFLAQSLKIIQKTFLLFYTFSWNCDDHMSWLVITKKKTNEASSSSIFLLIEKNRVIVLPRTKHAY